MRGAKNISRPNKAVMTALDHASHSPFVVGHGNANSMGKPLPLIPRAILMGWRVKGNGRAERNFGGVSLQEVPSTLWFDKLTMRLLRAAPLKPTEPRP